LVKQCSPRRDAPVWRRDVVFEERAEVRKRRGRVSTPVEIPAHSEF